MAMVLSKADTVELERFAEAIANEALTNDEVRQLLGRVGELEFGGGDTPTIAAVSEATGRSVLEVASLLESIRHQTFEEQYGRKLATLESKLDTTAQRVSRLEGNGFAQSRFDGVRLGALSSAPLKVVLRGTGFKGSGLVPPVVVPSTLDSLDREALSSAPPEEELTDNDYNVGLNLVIGVVLGVLLLFLRYALTHR